MPPGKKRVPDNEEFEARKRERQAAVVSKVQDLNAVDTKRYLDDICTKWKLDEYGHESTYQDAIELAFHNFGMSFSSDINASDISGRSTNGSTITRWSSSRCTTSCASTSSWKTRRRCAAP